MSNSDIIDSKDGGKPFVHHVEQADPQNTLVALSKDSVLAQVDDFVNAHGLQEYKDVFRKGALVAQRPYDFAAMAELDDDDKTSLAYELAHKWHLPWMMYYSVVVCALGAATQGWDQTGSNGASEIVLVSYADRQTFRSPRNSASPHPLASQVVRETSG